MIQRKRESTLISIKNILVTTDLSEASTSAMEYASWLANREKANVQLIYSVDNIPTVAYHTVDLTYDKFKDEILTLEHKKLLQYSNSFSSLFSQHIRVVLTEGPAAQSIVRYANDHQVDMIIMSTHGRTGIQHVLLGSVTERVVRTAKCPVLTIKSKNGIIESITRKSIRKSVKKSFK